MSIIVCRLKSLPLEKLEQAERRAIRVNPENEFDFRRVERTPPGRRGGERRIAVVVGRKWPRTGVRLSVSFLDNPSAVLRSRILGHMNAWGEHANVVFSETADVGEVRIARIETPIEDAGYWSYVGTEILEIEDEDEPTLNLEGFTMKTPESEFRRVVRHEAGHTLGFDHEHMRSDIVKRIDPKKAYIYFDRTNGWSEDETDQQVLTPLAKKSITGTTEADPLSIMCYQLPGSIMKDRKSVPGGLDINENDFAFAKQIYPKAERRTADAPPQREREPKPPVRTAAANGHEAVNPTFELVIMDEFRPETRAGEEKQKPKFARVFASYCGARVTSVMRLRADGDGQEKTRYGQIIGIHKRIKDYTGGVPGATLPNDEQMLEFGIDLFDTLFQDDVRRLYDEARTRERNQLDLVLTSMIPWIGEKPWEFAYDKGRGSYLATEEVNFIRNVLTSVPADPIVKTDGPLRILVASAQPVGLGKLSIEQEEAVIRRGFEPLVEAGLVEIETLARAAPSAIHGHISTGNYQVVHFIGHGEFDEERGEGSLIFVNENGGEYRLGERSVREIFRGRGLSLVFLNSCESGSGGIAEFNKGIAQSLVAHGLPALVANQYSVLDSSATSFAQHFYWSLAQGMSIGQSAREARIAVNYQLHGDPIDWAVPVVYARDPNERLCLKPVNPKRTPATAVTASARRSTAGHTVRVAVWDMDEVFPRLADTLEVMNRAQNVFGFELANLSVPFGVWDVATTEKAASKKAKIERGNTARKASKKGSGRTTDEAYIWAERLSERLQRMPMELGVEVLVCVTTQLLRDDERFNLFTWWPGENGPPIIIYSVAGFGEISPEGAETDRALANAAVTGLAGYFGAIGSHERPPKNCPLSFNENRDIEGIGGRLKFDPTCRNKLKAVSETRLNALEALLNTFQ